MKNIYVVGAGIFGCSIAIELAKNNYNIILIEKNNDILSGATKLNHNRIHFGYHYPRSIDTAKQSILGLSSFAMEYNDCIISDFENYYCIAKKNSNVSSLQYENFCTSAGIDFQKTDINDDIINKDLISTIYKVNEPVYDIDILKAIIKNKLEKYSVEVKLNSPIESFNFNDNDQIINCTYSNLNRVNNHLGAELIPGKYQDVLIPVISLERTKIGLTVMDGPFCSLMPRGDNKNEFLVYHVLDSVLEESLSDFNATKKDVVKEASIILENSKKYYPFLKDAKIIDYWRVKRFIPDSKETDSRVSQILVSKSNPNVISIFSGKVTTAVTIAKTVKNLIENGELRNIYV